MLPKVLAGGLLSKVLTDVMLSKVLACVMLPKVLAGGLLSKVLTDVLLSKVLADGLLSKVLLLSKLLAVVVARWAAVTVVGRFGELMPKVVADGAVIKAVGTCLIMITRSLLIPAEGTPCCALAKPHPSTTDNNIDMYVYNACPID